MRPANKINEILHGRRSITVETALELELVLGLPAYFWLELEQNYQLVRSDFGPSSSYAKRLQRSRCFH